MTEGHRCSRPPALRLALRMWALDVLRVLANSDTRRWRSVLGQARATRFGPVGSTVFRPPPVARRRDPLEQIRYASRRTVPGEKAGRHTAMYSAPPT
jgi:hypothetical protein